ncbi:hypothetical protein FO488_12115 [Geobacter sp. FeAm09]|uniref:hypothetical protein n=1 Tax=Geobacter sp. FeAm09 TaxID=2597769 RepID=UPI0011EF5BBD|nr:hypothetical protein [Geobacter sp. FeAm09]QEM68829.1 hypothetical protein FO488_12115 [Geobacter sp. FeAm09]
MRRTLVVIMFLHLLCGGGCAVFNRDNTPALNFVEQHLIPKENPGRALSYPLVIPVGLTAATLDMFLFHPLSVTADAWHDTSDLLWDNMDWDRHYVTTSASIVPRVAAVPLVFTGDFLARSSFDISHGRGGSSTSKSSPEPERERKRTEAKKNLDMARQALAQQDLDTAIRLADEVVATGHYQYEAGVIKDVVLLKRHAPDALFAMPFNGRMFGDPLFVETYADLLANGSPAERMQLLAIFDRFYFAVGTTISIQGKNGTPLSFLMPALEKNLTDEDRAIRMKTMQALGKFQRSDKGVRALLEGVARGSDPVLATAAKSLLR